MDTHDANELTFNSCHNSYENAEINIDNIIIAVAELNNRILRLREEIFAFNNKDTISSIVTHNLSSLTPADFNHSTKNGENRTGAQYEPRRNFKGDNSPGGTDLSARLSFAKRAREVKATNEAAVFKEDYPRDDKSIEDDKRPNRSRVSEPSRTYRKSISDVEKSEKETDERPGDALRNTGDARISRVADEKLRKLNELRNDVVSETSCSSVNVFTYKIKRKRISRGVQCVSFECRSYASRFFLSCFRLKSRRSSLAPKMKKKKVLMNKFNVELRNEVNKLLDATTVCDKSGNVIEEKIKSNDTNRKKKKFEKVGDEKMGEITCEKDTIKNYSYGCKIWLYDGEKLKNDSKYCRVKINFFEKLKRLRRVSTCKNDSKVQQNESHHNCRHRKEEIAGLSYETKRVNGTRKREDNSQSVKIVDHEMDSSNGQKTIVTACADNGCDVNKIKERLDSCIAELNGIIGDACAIFGNRKSDKE